MAQLQQYMMMLEQQKEQQIKGILLAEKAFKQCIDKPDSSLSSSEERCLRAVAGKFLDTNEFVVARLQKSAQQQQQFA